MVEENHNLIYTFLQKYHLSIEDYYGLAAIGLCNAAINFDGSKASFSTYAYKCMYTDVFMENKREKSKKRIPVHQIVYYENECDDSNCGDTSTFMNYIPSKENVEENALSEIILREYMSGLKSRDKQILALFSEGYKQIEISKIVGCSQPQISRVRKKLCKYLAS